MTDEQENVENKKDEKYKKNEKNGDKKYKMINGFLEMPATIQTIDTDESYLNYKQ